MREAIGQLMTNEYIPPTAIPVVAVPYSEKSVSLANKWAQLQRIRDTHIQFFLVKEDGSIFYA